MVNVGGKAISARRAVAECKVRLTSEIMQQLDNGDLQSKKGPVFQTAILAGTMAAKKTADLIPLCHNIPLDQIKIKISPDSDHTVLIRCEAKTSHKTGVEMEALTGASVAALTIYDMCKALSHNIVIEEIILTEKTGGKSDFKK